MSLTESQLFFVLKTLGKDKFYYGGGHFPGVEIEESLIQEISNPLGYMAQQLAVDANISYDERDQIILNNPITPQNIQNIAETVGIQIPTDYQTSSEKALDYIQTYGYLYQPFTAKNTFPTVQNYPPTLWIDLPNVSSNVSNPSVSGLDKYINPFLRTHLRDLYTDYDLISRFPDLNLEKHVRPDKLDIVMSEYRPSGEFWFSFGFTGIKLEHTYQGQTKTYHGVSQIMSIVDEGVLKFNNRLISWVGLYQLALLVQPEYFKSIYGLDLTSELYENIFSLFVHFLGQIRIAEYQNSEQYRFSQYYDDLNFYLNQTESELVTSDKLEQIAESLQ